MLPTDSNRPLKVPSFGEAFVVWARIGVLGFGGPAGQIALMHRELVEERRWIGEERFLHALNYCMLLPGPEAQQLATYIGWLLHRTPGGLAAGILFVVPGALSILSLSILYALYREAPLADGLFFGIKAAVVAVVAGAVLRLGRRALRSWPLGAIAAAAFLAINVFSLPFPLIVVLAGLAGLILGRVAPAALAGRGPAAAGQASASIDLLFARGDMAHTQPGRFHIVRTLAVWLPVWLGPVGLMWLVLGRDSIWTQLGSFFSLMAVVTFGGAYAALAYVAQAAVETFGWLTPGEMLDGLGLAETTPGPLILVLQFVGFIAASRQAGGLDPLVAGALGSLVVTWVTFAPCFLWIFLGAPYIERLAGNARLSAALSAITAAVVGVMLNLALWFALHVLFRDVREIGPGIDVPVAASLDLPAALLVAVSLVALVSLRIGLFTLIVAAALAGVAVEALRS